MHCIHLEVVYKKVTVVLAVAVVAAIVVEVAVVVSVKVAVVAVAVVLYFALTNKKINMYILTYRIKRCTL